MTKLRGKFSALLAGLALLLSACSTVETNGTDLLGTWYQNDGTADLIWSFKADGTVNVHSWAGGHGQAGVFRKLNGDRVALDFGADAASIVDITVAGNKMMMVNPGGARTMLQKK